jgi:hypothetical protein
MDRKSTAWHQSVLAMAFAIPLTPDPASAISGSPCFFNTKAGRSTPVQLEFIQPGKPVENGLIDSATGGYPSAAARRFASFDFMWGTCCRPLNSVACGHFAALNKCLKRLTNTKPGYL